MTSQYAVMSIIAKLEQGLTSRSSEETMNIAQELAILVPDESVITLSGDLGAGKTTFVKGLAKAWRIHDVVTSPTFNIYNIYQGERMLMHMDAYRLEPDRDAFEELMIEDFLKPPFCLAIEWPSRITWLPYTAFIALEFRIQIDGNHEIIKIG